jgi:hypothetical protein
MQGGSVEAHIADRGHNPFDVSGIVNGTDGIRRDAGLAEIVEELSTGDLGAYACALGGDDGKTLFICVAPDFSSEKRKASTEARIVSTRVEVAHDGLP